MRKTIVTLETLAKLIGERCVCLRVRQGEGERFP